MATDIQPVRIGANYLAGLQGAQDLKANRLAMDTQRQRNALAQEAAQQQRMELNDEQHRQFATKMVQAAQYGLASQTPKAFIEQNYPQLVQLAGPEWAQLDDNGVKAKLQEAIGIFGPRAGIGPAQPKTEADFTLSPGQKRFGADGKVLAEVAPNPERGQGMFRAATPQEIAAYGLPAGTAAQINTQTGQLNVLPGTSGGNITEGERTAANYYGRMLEAEDLLGTDFKPSTAQYMAARTVMNGGPVSSTLANKYLDANAQKYYQAAADWVRAKLRKESGAVISPQEMEQEIKTYFPMPGDDDATITQKRQARLQAQQGMRRMGGRASGEYDSSRPPKSSGPVRVSTPEEAMALPSGTEFITPDGRKKVRP